MDIVTIEKDSKEHKKMRMLAIRKLVKDHITGKEKGNVPYLAKLELDKEDNTRLVIALQDLVDDERGRHARARGHIVQLRGMVEELKTGCVQISNAAYESSQRLKHAAQRILDQSDTIAKLQAKIIDKDRQLDALLDLVAEQRNPPMQATAPATPATMGESNRVFDRHGNQWTAKERG